jgi:ATP-dependent RNA helicase DeaD
LEITVGRRNSVASNIEHSNYIIKEKDRYQALKRIIDFYPEIFGLIFCRTRNETRQVAEKLIKDEYNAEALHGELSQGQRDYVMRRFREKSLQLLVATDVAARGLDVDDISHVINYNLPDEPDIYTHRSGRTARAGKSGISVVLMNTREKRKLALVEQKAGITFSYAKVPSGHAVCEKQLFEMVERMVAVDINHAEIEKFLPAVYSTLAGLSKEELIQKFVSTEFNRFLSYYKNAHDINAKITKNRNDKPASGKKRHPNRKTKRFSINVGRQDNIREGAITRLICANAGIRSNQIGKIELLREFSFFEIETDVAQKVLKSLKRAKLDGMEIRAEYAEKKKTYPRPENEAPRTKLRGFRAKTNKSKKNLLKAKGFAKKLSRKQIQNQFAI